MATGLQGRVDISRTLCRSADPASWDAANLHADKPPVVPWTWWLRDIQHNVSAVGSVDATHSEASLESCSVPCKHSEGCIWGLLL